jgi:hypothetical protein
VTLPLFVCFLTPGVAQVDRAGLSGTISDAAGAVIPGIHVVVSMPDTGRVGTRIAPMSGPMKFPNSRLELTPSPSRGTASVRLSSTT